MQQGHCTPPLSPGIEQMFAKFQSMIIKSVLQITCPTPSSPIILWTREPSPPSLDDDRMKFTNISRKYLQWLEFKFPTGVVLVTLKTTYTKIRHRRNEHSARYIPNSWLVTETSKWTNGRG